MRIPEVICDVPKDSNESNRLVSSKKGLQHDRSEVRQIAEAVFARKHNRNELASRSL